MTITDSHTVAVCKDNNIIVESEQDIERTSNFIFTWEEIPLSQKTPQTLYGFSEDDLLDLGAQALVEALLLNPVECMKMLGLTVKIPTLSE